MNEAQMRAEFEAWWANFQSEHEEWKYADGEDLLFQAWLAALASQAKSVPDDEVPYVSLEEIRELLATCSPLPKDDDRVRELEKDAARYRWLRDNCSSADEGGLGMIATDLQFTSLINHELVKKWPDALDKSIDQAIASMAGEQK